MRFFTSTLSTAARVSSAQKKHAFSGIRSYSSQPVKKGGNGLVLLTLAGLGAAAGIYYNQNTATVKQHVEPLSTVAAAAAEKAFDPSQFKPFKLQKVEPINHNTSLYRFELDSDNHVAGLPIASCVITRYPITKKDGSTGYVIRPYTPTSTADTKGHVDFIIKVYPEGKMSQHIHNLKVGETLEIKGPFPKYNWEENPVENVGMIAGGTGITPMLQIIRKVFDAKSPDDKTKITLIFANEAEDDILLKDELDTIAKQNPDRFKVVYALNKPPKDWSGPTGFVNADLIKSHLPGPENDKSIVFVCGPDPMLAALSGPKAQDKSQGELAGVLKELGYAKERVYKF
ncbi:NADH-cytochrome b5 reductase [Apophysomyces ossiformis]|uniref:NADH-cytochrome b5 reductase n=1 Tax=Apophysomyces ossiformis TaxID=679940 RepID=A0A8H7EQF0_9FUNG|nr:NADH-cytochrome b5 reductase [Apophysomyces ossiformis]